MEEKPEYPHGRASVLDKESCCHSRTLRRKRRQKRRENRPNNAPQLYDLTTLQREAPAARNTLGLAQALYEATRCLLTRKIRYLPEDYISKVHETMRDQPTQNQLQIGSQHNEEDRLKFSSAS